MYHATFKTYNWGSIITNSFGEILIQSFCGADALYYLALVIAFLYARGFWNNCCDKFVEFST